MTKRILTYCAIFTGPIAGFMSLYMHGWWTWSLPIYAFVFIPLVEFISPGNTTNLSDTEEQEALSTKFFDYLVYAMVPLQYIFLIAFLIPQLPQCFG